MRWLLTPFARAWRWFDERTGTGRVVRYLALHRVPPGVTSLRRGWWYVFGFATLFAFIIQGLTGAALATMYIPSTDAAYDSLQFITEEATFGRFIRGLHYFGASAIVVLLTAHLVRVYLTGAFKYPREVNWLSGVVLLFLTLALTFTGMLLRWDADSLGSVLIAVEQAGRAPLVGEWIARFILAGETISGTTLSRFYAAHVFVLPALLIAVLGLHLYLVLRNGISEPPKAGRPVDPATYRAWYQRRLERSGRPYWPDAAWREIVFAFGLVLVLSALALVFGPRPLTEPPDPTLTEVTPRPDWYFLWYQAYLEMVPRHLSDWAVFLTPVLLFTALILVPFVAGRGERSISKRPWSAGIVLAGGAVLGVLVVVGFVRPFVPEFDVEPLAPVQLEPLAQEGYDEFVAHGCQYCHMVRGEGGRYGPDLTHVSRRYPVEQLKVIILRGRDDMPDYRRSLTEQELDAIIAFLESLTEPVVPQ